MSMDGSEKKIKRWNRSGVVGNVVDSFVTFDLRITVGISVKTPFPILHPSPHYTV